MDEIIIATIVTVDDDEDGFKSKPCKAELGQEFNITHGCDADEESGEQEVKHHENGGDKDGNVEILGKNGSNQESNTLSDEGWKDGDGDKLSEPGIGAEWDSILNRIQSWLLCP